MDTREGSVAQSQEVVAAFKEQLNRDEFTPRRLATVVSSALFKRQVERIAFPNGRLFMDPTEALAWLLSPTD